MRSPVRRGASAMRPPLRRLGLGMLTLALAASSLQTGSASTVSQEFRDSFDTKGPLQGTAPNHPYEIKNGVWTVTDADLLAGNPSQSSNRILVQSSLADTPNEPLVFVRGHSFREVTAEVTIAVMGTLERMPQGASAGIVVRAPVHNGIADADNFYLFSSFVTGVSKDYPTGRALGLFKRVARGYYLLDNQVVHTWADITRPHRYKVVMGHGRIRAYFDGRLVIDHVDLPSGEHPTPQDPFPLLPFDQGAVGLRTSVARAWFDDLVVVGNDAHEGRAFALDVYAQFGESSQVRRGDAITTNQLARTYGANRLDTGFAYGAAGIDKAAVRALENPFNPDSEFGGTVKTESKDDTVTSTVRLAGGELFVREPMNRSISATIVSKGIETVASATCDATTSRVRFTDTSIQIDIADDPVLPDLTIGPIPLNTEYQPNTVIWERAGILSIVAHHQVRTAAPRRIEASALRIVIPDGGFVRLDAFDLQVPNVTNYRFPGAGVPVPPLDATVAGVTAGRYCR